MEQIHIDRLKLLAHHLISGHLGHKKFDYASYNDGMEGSQNRCGTIGCAIGECPIIFSADWAFANDGNPGLRKIIDLETNNYNLPQMSGTAFFQIQPVIYNYLFVPNSFCPFGLSDWGLPKISPNTDATRIDVGKHIGKVALALEKHLTEL